MKDHNYIQMKESFKRFARENKAPIFGHYELTGRCNLDCKMCYVHNQSNAEFLKKELSTEQWKQIFDEAFDLGLLYATLSGGECLIRNDFKELYLHLWDKRVFVSVFTNGTLLNQDYIDFFKQYTPDAVQISLYGSDEDGYLRVTGHKGYEKALFAISSLKDAGIDVRVVVTPSSYMKEDYINILKMCNQKGIHVENKDILLVDNRDDPIKNDYYLTEEEIISLSVQRAELNGLLSPVDCVPDVCGPMAEDPQRGLTCNAGNCLATVTWDGIMYPCYNATIGDGASLLEMSYAEAWEKTKKAAAEVVMGAECVGCAYDKTCPKCPAFRLTDLHSGHCNPMTCELTRKLVISGAKKLI